MISRLFLWVPLSPPESFPKWSHLVLAMCDGWHMVKMGTNFPESNLTVIVEGLHNHPLDLIVTLHEVAWRNNQSLDVSWNLRRDGGVIT